MPSSTSNRRLLITAGPTHEPIDAVRYLANRSSGRLGIALATAALDLGHETTLLLGPASIAIPESTALTVARFQTTAELQTLLAREWPAHDVLIMAAAVADYRPRRLPPDAKLRRTGDTLTLDLEPTPDLLAELAENSRPDQVRIGFALEPADRLEASARDKLTRKQLDAIVANPLETMESAAITATLYWRDGSVCVAPPALDKDAFAVWLLKACVVPVSS